MEDKQALLLELDKLKSVYRRSYLTDHSRNENSAEHSWHLALALMALEGHIPSSVNIHHAIKLALVHDICEIGAGDVSVYSSERQNIKAAEDSFMTGFASRHAGFGTEAKNLWLEYESQTTPESRWVKVVDRLLPFLLNLAAEGKTWKEQSIRRQQVIGINKVIANEAPEIFNWMEKEIGKAVKKGWLLDE